MAENKTKPTSVSAEGYIDHLEHPVRRADAWRLLELHREITGFEPVMWGPSIIGFDSYHYEYASGHSGDAAAAGFSPRKAHQVLYVSFEFPGCEELLAQLGKYKRSKACLYITKLADVDESILREVVTKSYAHTKEFYDDPVA